MKKATFTLGHESYEATTNEKEYGARKLVYIDIRRVGGNGRGSKVSYSVRDEAFVDYRAGDLDSARLAAQVLGITELEPTPEPAKEEVETSSTTVEEARASSTTPATKTGGLAWKHSATRWNKKATWNATDVAHLGFQFVSVKKSAEILGISESTMRRWIKSGVIKSELRYKDGALPSVVDGKVQMRKEFSGEYHSERAYMVVSRYDLAALVLGRKY